MSDYDVEFRFDSYSDYMVVSYPVGDYETGSEIFSFYNEKPENVIKETGILHSPRGLVQCGIQLRDKTGHGVAWLIND